jgi:hypothetical protein
VVVEVGFPACGDDGALMESELRVIIFIYRGSGCHDAWVTLCCLFLCEGKCVLTTASNRVARSRSIFPCKSVLDITRLLLKSSCFWSPGDGVTFSCLTKNLKQRHLVMVRHSHLVTV